MGIVDDLKFAQAAPLTVEPLRGSPAVQCQAGLLSLEMEEPAEAADLEKPDQGGLGARDR